MRTLFDYLFSIRDLDVRKHHDEIRKNIKKFLENKIMDEEFSIGTFVLYFPEFKYIYTQGTEETFGKDYMSDNVESVNEFFKKMHPSDLIVHHEKMQPYLHNFVKSLPPQQLCDWVFTFDFRILNDAGKPKSFLGKNMMVLNDNREIIFIFGRAFEVSSYHTMEPGKVTLTISHHCEGSVKEFSKVFYHEESCYLSPREKEILMLLKAGNTSQQISELLFISPNTVNNHRKNMLKKTNTRNTMELVDFALRKGLI